MIKKVAMRPAWLVIAAGNARAHAGNDGYDDQVDAYYSWDSTVANRDALKVGDPIVLWNKNVLLGASVIESIEYSEDEKILRRCPKCNSTKLKIRKHKHPKFLCFNCNHNFFTTVIELKRVSTYRARYDAGWVNLENVIDATQLRLMAISPKSQQSMRPLNWDLFEESIKTKMGPDSLQPLTRRFTDAEISPKYTTRIRSADITNNQSFCVFTGTTPTPLLEIGNLFKFDKIGEIKKLGYLPIRKEIRQLLDCGHAAINPRTMKIEPTQKVLLANFDFEVPRLRLISKPSESQEEWIQAHWELHQQS